jgi:hypothetical protein
VTATEPVQAASISVTVNVTTTPSLRTVARSSTNHEIRGIALVRFSKRQVCPLFGQRSQLETSTRRASAIPVDTCDVRLPRR